MMQALGVANSTVGLGAAPLPYAVGTLLCAQFGHFSIMHPPDGDENEHSNQSVGKLQVSVQQPPNKVTGYARQTNGIACITISSRPAPSVSA